MLWPDASTDTVANWGISVLAVAAGYLAGCFTAGYYLVRWRSGADIRREGSGSSGATNVGRALGRSGFLITFTSDMAKGALVAWMAASMGLGPWARLFCSLAVVVGHIWPVQLRFRGGKGVAPLLGVLLVADYRIVIIMAGICFLVLAFFHRFTLSGLVALAVTPPAVAVFFPPSSRALGLLLLELPVLYAHRQNIREDVGSRYTEVARRSSAGLPTRKDSI